MTTESLSLEERSFRKGLKVPIAIGSALGVFPRNDVFAKDQSRKKCWQRGVLLYSVVLTTFLWVNALLKITQYLSDFRKNNERNFMEKLGSSTQIAYPCAVAFAYTCQHFYSRHFLALIGNFTSSLSLLGPGCLGRKPASFPIFCWLITLTCLLVGIVENLWFEVQGFTEAHAKRPHNFTVLGHFYKGFTYWHPVLLTDSPVVTLLLFILLKICKYGWVLMDAVIIILCHTLSIHFKWLHEAIRNRPVEGTKSLTDDQSKFKDLVEQFSVVKVEPLSNGKETTFTWETTLEKFWLLEDLTFQVENYVAPLILISFVCIWQILIILFAWIAPDISVSLSISSSHTVMFSSLYYCFRVGIVTYFVSEVHHSAHDILGTVERCKNASYHLATERLERKLVGNPVGIRLFGTFLITRHFIVSVISCIVTTEIILLQMGNANRPQK